MDILFGILHEYIVYIAGAFFILLTVVPYLMYEKAKSSRTRRERARAEELGLAEPVTIHPRVDRGKCIGSGACIKACPQKKVLGVVNNKAMAVCSSECVGHGACARACPVGAIELVFGSERRGVDIPQVYPNFESNVNRLYIAGELGGMGLIKNSVVQGQQAVEYIAQDMRENPYREEGCYDLVIVGAGPAGLSASLQARKEKLRSITIEREEDFGGAILSYPRAKVVMTSPVNVPLYGKVKAREITKEGLIDLWDDIAGKTRLKVSLSEGVVEARDESEVFVVKTTKRELTCRYLLLCVGRRGIPRKLGVPGEKSAKVMYRLLEPERYASKKVLVVGGGDSAVEAAMALAGQGAQVTLSYRGEAFSRVKAANRDKLVQMSKAGKLRVMLQSNVVNISDDRVTLEKNGKTRDIKNDFVFVFAGGVAPNAFLEKVGVIVETKYGTR